MDDSKSPHSLDMVAGSILHMARYLHSGCPRAERLSELLLDRAGESAELPAELLAACKQLQAAIWRREMVSP